MGNLEALGSDRLAWHLAASSVGIGADLVNDGPYIADVRPVFGKEAEEVQHGAALDG
jgi:hypothetical protein